MQLIKQRIRVILLEDKFSIPFRFNNHPSAIKNSEENFPRDTIFPAPFLSNRTNFHNYHFRLLFKITEVSRVYGTFLPSIAER